MKDSEPPAFKFYVDDFSSDGVVEAMSTAGVGAYILLLCKAWRERPCGSLPSNDRLLARWSRLTSDEWSAVKAEVLAAFTLGTDSRWHQKRMRREFEKLKSSTEAKTESARNAANRRWKRTSMQPHCGGTADALPGDASSSSDSDSNSLKGVNPLKPPAGWPPELSTDSFAEAWSRWTEYRKEIRKALTKSTTEAQLKKLATMGHDDAIKAIDASITSGWIGLFEPDKQPRGGSKRGDRKLATGPGQKYDPGYTGKSTF